jgi:hypothetical protein
MQPNPSPFASKADAKAWAKRVEGQIEASAGNHQPAIPTEPEPAKVSMTLGETLKLYLRDITPTKKGSKQETNRIKAWLRAISLSPSLSLSLSLRHSPALPRPMARQAACGRQSDLLPWGSLG